MPRGAGGRVELVKGVVVVMVRTRRGWLSFLVRRMEEVVADWADFRARWRGARGTSRFMVLEGEADWMVWSSSKMASWKR